MHAVKGSFKCVRAVRRVLFPRVQLDLHLILYTVKGSFKYVCAGIGICVNVCAHVRHVYIFLFIK